MDEFFGAFIQPLFFLAVWGAGGAIIGYCIGRAHYRVTYGTWRKKRRPDKGQRYEW